MAVARMLHVAVIGYDGIVNDVVSCLQDAGVLEIAQSELEQDGVALLQPDEHRLHELDEAIARAQFVRDFLGRYREADVAFGAFVSEKIHLSTQEYETLTLDAAFRELYRECDLTSARLAEIERERIRLTALRAELLPWSDLRLQIAQWKGTERVALFTGTVPCSDSAQVRQALRDAVDEVSVAEAGCSGEREAWVVMAHHTRLDEVRSVLALTEFAEVSFPDLEDYPAEEIALIDSHLESFGRERTRLEERIRELAAEYPRMAGLVQRLLSERDAVQVHECFQVTERTFLLTGWVPSRAKEDLLAALAPLGTDVDVSFRDPEPQERVPVKLHNLRLIRPFEVLTDLYGRPRYGQLDPTPFMAVFFFLFFGMCLGDVGYGVVLAVAAVLIKTRLDVGAGVKRFMDLLILGGISSVLVGIATRSYFALSADKLPAFLQYKPLLDPLPDLMLLLGVSVALGVVHVSLGVAVSAYSAIRAGRWVDAVSEDISVLVFLGCLVGGLLRPDALGTLLVIGFAQLVPLKGRILDPLTGGAPLWTLVLVPLKGFLGVYGMVGLGSDFLSYTRLAALGLASLMVGDAMNRLADLAADIPVAGLFAAALILVVGHAFNVVINLLGAFVHPTRLQYVEFFSKFYEAGGRSFAPFGPRRERLVLHPRPAGEKEGGFGS